MVKDDDSHWIWNIIYYNPDDPDFLVPKHYGLGYTFNFANKISWVICCGIVLMIVVVKIGKKKAVK